MAHVKLPKACSPYGASMGRPSFGGACDDPGIGSLDQIPLQGDYDNGGAYWGAGDPLYRFSMTLCDETIAERWFRALSREQALETIRGEFPSVTFAESEAAPDEFVNAYIEAMLWSTSGTSPKCPDPDCEHVEECELREEYESLEGFDLADETQAQCRADCDRFWAQAQGLISSETYIGRSSSGAEAMAGHDFWLTRAGHGCGFWDGDWREPEAAKLTELSKAAGEAWPYIGDDGLVYL